MIKLFSQPEGASPITDEQKEGLKEKWVSTQEELNQIEQNNILLAQEWLFSSRKKNTDFADISFIVKLHKKMLGNVYSWAGNLRATQTNIGDPPHLIRQNIASLRLDVHTWIENKAFSQDEIAVRFHHKLVCIHPFDNGNGRICRLLADYINEQFFDNEPFSWGSDDLFVNGTARSTYMNAIYKANNEQIEDLVAFARN
ncbi:MAG: mobile mystery protein B [Bacteroidetes bacterium]|nr:MAG: mobile mystery protein B [Bacteroidota bacterium]